MSQVVIVDIDGTIAHHTEEQRGHFDYGKVETDTPIGPIIELVQILWERNGDWANRPHYDIVFMSGREESCRDLTEAWLRTYLPWLEWQFAGDDVVIPEVELYMRVTGDHRRDDVVKRELYEAHIVPREVAYVLEDRNRNVAMWRSLGLTCLQVADGDF